MFFGTSKLFERGQLKLVRFLASPNFNSRAHLIIRDKTFAIRSSSRVAAAEEALLNIQNKDNISEMRLGKISLCSFEPNN